MPSLRHLTAIWACALLSACATLPPNTKRDQRDPFERYNRAVYGFNRGLDQHVAQPVARGYVKAVPLPLRHGVHNFVTNLGYPRTLINDALQGKFAYAGTDLLRLTTNTVLGLGWFDPASALGLESHDEDFGQTLGRWGVHAGPYFVLPVLGPASIRDTIARVPDEYTTGRHYIQDSTVKWSVAGLDLLDSRASLLETEGVLQQSFDEYSFVRNAWLQRRNYQVRDGDVPDESLELPAP
jgi:phospholipid-binding lipoprotein MlaA